VRIQVMYSCCSDAMCIPIGSVSTMQLGLWLFHSQNEWRVLWLQILSTEGSRKDRKQQQRSRLMASCLQINVVDNEGKVISKRFATAGLFID